MTGIWRGVSERERVKKKPQEGGTGGATERRTDVHAFPNIVDVLVFSHVGCTASE